MNKTNHLEFKVGLFFLVGLGLLFLAVLILGDKSGLWKKQYTLYAYFEDVSGLKEGSPVQLNGISVGQVAGLNFEEVRSEAGSDIKVKTKLRINLDYQSRICNDTKATVVTEGLLGDRAVFLTVGCETHQGLALKDNDFISQVSDPKTMSQWFESADKLMSQATHLIDTSQQTAFELKGLIQDVRTQKGMVHELIYNPDLAKDLTQSAQHLNKTTQHLSSVTQKVDEGQGTLGAFVNDPAVYYELKTLLGKANRNKLVRTVVRHTLKTKSSPE